MIHYLDTSALVKRYVAEPGSEAIRSLFRRRRHVAVVRIAHAELAAAVARLEREGALDAAARDRVLERLDAHFRAVTVVETRPALLQNTRSLVVRYPLRGYDAVHLAASLLVREQGAPLTSWSADGTQLDAARSEGLRAVDPVTL